MMFHDGLIGTKGILTGISALTTGNLNSKLKQGAKAFTIKDVIPLAHDYILPPLTPEEKAAQANQQLLSLLSQMPEANKHLKVADGLRSQE